MAASARPPSLSSQPASQPASQAATQPAPRSSHTPSTACPSPASLLALKLPAHPHRTRVHPAPTPPARHQVLHLHNGGGRRRQGQGADHRGGRHHHLREAGGRHRRAGAAGRRLLCSGSRPSPVPWASWAAGLYWEAFSSRGCGSRLLCTLLWTLGPNLCAMGLESSSSPSSSEPWNTTEAREAGAGGRPLARVSRPPLLPALHFLPAPAPLIWTLWTLNPLHKFAPQPVTLADFKTPGADLQGVAYLRNVQVGGGGVGGGVGVGVWWLPPGGGARRARGAPARADAELLVWMRLPRSPVGSHRDWAAQHPTLSLPFEQAERQGDPLILCWAAVVIVQDADALLAAIKACKEAGGKVGPG